MEPRSSELEGDDFSKYFDTNYRLYKSETSNFESLLEVKGWIVLANLLEFVQHQLPTHHIYSSL